MIDIPYGLFFVKGEYRKIPNISSELIEARKQVLVDLSRYRGSLYAMYMYIHYPIYIHKSPNVYISKDIWDILQGAYVRGLIFRILQYYFWRA